MKRMTKKMLLGLNRELEQQLKGQENAKLKIVEWKKALDRKETTLVSLSCTLDTLKTGYDTLEKSYLELKFKHAPNDMTEEEMGRWDTLQKPAVAFAHVNVVTSSDSEAGERVVTSSDSEEGK